MIGEDNKYVVDEETAAQEFERFLETHELEIDERGLDDEDRRSAYQAKKTFIKMVMLGRLTLNEGGFPVYKLKDGSAEITFKDMDGAALIAQDQKKSGHEMAKTLATLGAITGKPPQFFATMKGPDIKVCLHLLQLFLS